MVGSWKVDGVEKQPKNALENCHPKLTVAFGSRFAQVAGSRFVIYEIRSQAETFCTQERIRKSLEMPAVRIRCNLSFDRKFMTSGETFKLNLYLSLH